MRSHSSRASQLDLPEAQLVFTPHQKNGKTVRLDLASQTGDKSRRAVQNFPKGTVTEKGHTRIWQVGVRRLSARCWWSLSSKQGGMEIPGRMIVQDFHPQASLYGKVWPISIHIAEDLSKEASVVLPTTISKEILNGWKVEDKDQVTSTEDRK